jgi:hypothetical protein
MRPNTILPSLVGAAPPGLETHGAGVCHCACGSAHALAGARACAPEAVSGATSIGLPRAFDGLMASLSRRNARGCGVNAGASCRAGHRRGKDEARRGPKRRGERAARRRGRRARLPVARNERRCEHRDGRDERRVDDAGARSISD